VRSPYFGERDSQSGSGLYRKTHMALAGRSEGASGGVASAEMIDSQLIGELLGLLAHDLRNPLSALHSNLGYLDTVLSSHDGEAREAVEDGVVSCDGLSHVIDNVDLLGQVLRGGLRVNKSPSPVAALIAGAVERCQPAARSHGLTLELDVKARQLHVAVDVGRDLATRALTNLIRNSIQHAPPSTTVTVTASAEGESVCVQVRDAGAALTDDTRESAFTALGQVAAKTRSNSRYSRGMGLYCARLAASLCGAEIRVLSNASGIGNTFQLSLPQVQAG
jgi:signal transduction histidine kinase